jgi:hypothetical protein
MKTGETLVFAMANPDPTKAPEFQRVLGNLLKAKPKPHADMKLGKKRRSKNPSKNRRAARD